MESANTNKEQEIVFSYAFLNNPKSKIIILKYFFSDNLFGNLMIISLYHNIEIPQLFHLI